ncbi:MULTISPECIES: PilZ domain-containing protein [Rhodopseudomonas]|uniref:Pilus assembly protein PilZ n=1 Tax=Rhodopseudomonas palustris TaxID=1076 RepID=A0A0D7E0D8_RHOPL|nr:MULTISPECIES: PilZ domain-containing protein [Rhodopseudomonas]KIZ33132.1 pilus assembly protein PilZ [Rhodopseudomonas palustris]MDF3809432.1 PilZ domain-containing protein [Rhodopseudomonas sp. BAL398]WOK20719.1 PilZ domain-containing protein [Rhodopseudomonas sp. BAL398]
MSVQRFLKQRAVSIAVGGNYTLPNWYDAQGKLRSFACRTSRVSPFRMIVDAPVVGRIGDSIASYFGDFGELKGHISDTIAGGFLLELDMTRKMREKISNQLTWLEKKQSDPTIRDVRAQARIVPSVPHSILAFSDGSTRSCFVIDMSLSGVAVSADVQPEIGTPLAVGSCVGRVVRHLPDGFAVQFTELQHRAELERRIARPPPCRAEAAAKPARSRSEPDSEDYFLI